VGGANPGQVPCTSAQTLCQPGEVCCYSLTSALNDHCGASGSCGSDEIELQCNNKEDCPGEKCCAIYGAALEGTGCKPSCTNGNITLCDDGTDCIPGKSCDASFPPLDPYAKYRWCQ
jgi:hypothetical protein